MPRYRQVQNEDGSFSLIEIGKSIGSSASAAVHGDLERFVSPVDGTVIEDRKQLREHNLRNNVVNADEYGDAACNADARQKRIDFMSGKVSRQEKQARREQMWEIANMLERQNG